MREPTCTRAVRRGLGAAACAVLLAACGGARPSPLAHLGPGQVLARAQAALDAARSVHVVGVVRSGATRLGLDLRLADGRGAVGTLSQGAGTVVHVVVLGPTAFLSGTPAFWRQYGGAAAASRLDGHWLREPVDGAGFAALRSLTDARALLAALLAAHGPLVRVAAAGARVGGRPVVILRDSTTGGTLAVAATGASDPLALTRPGADGGTLRFSSFGATVTLRAPRASLVVTGAGAGGG